MDDLAAERTLLKGRLEWQLPAEKSTGGIFWNTKAARHFWKRQGKHPLLPHSGYLYGWHDGHGGGKEAAETDTDCLLVLSRPRPTMRWRAFRYGRCTIWSSPLPKRTSTRWTDELFARIPQPDKYMELKVEGSEIHLRLSGYHLRRTLRPLDLRPYDGSKDACHTPTLPRRSSPHSKDDTRFLCAGAE